MFKWLKKRDLVDCNIGEITYVVTTTYYTSHEITAQGSAHWCDFFNEAFVLEVSLNKEIDKRSDNGFFRISDTLQIPICNIKYIQTISAKDVIIKV